MEDIDRDISNLRNTIEQKLSTGQLHSKIDSLLKIIGLDVDIYEYPIQDEIAKYAIIGFAHKHLTLDRVTISKGKYIGKRSTYFRVIESEYLDIHQQKTDGYWEYFTGGHRGKIIDIKDEYPDNIKNNNDLISIFKSNEIRENIDDEDIIHYMVLSLFFEITSNGANYEMDKGDYSDWDY
jgi:hypothetical protein